MAPDRAQVLQAVNLDFEARVRGSLATLIRLPGRPERPRAG
jgi:hypothetical protein